MNSTIYIRQDNEARWNAITDKSAWVNAMLEKSPPNSKAVEFEPPKERPGIHGVSVVEVENGMTKTLPKETIKVIRHEMSTEEIVEAAKSKKDIQFCKHNQVKGFCKHGCK